MTNPDPTALQAILVAVAKLNAEGRQPSRVQLFELGHCASDINYLRTTGLLGLYAGLYVTEAGHEALELARP
jgi:hypothetical protein